MSYIKYLVGCIFGGMVCQSLPLQAQVSSPALIQVERIKINSITGDNQIYPLTSAQKQTERIYFDGFGRPIQDVQMAASPSGKDIVTYATYGIVGANGPQSTSYLPYVGADGAGEFHTSAATEQTAYYNNGLSDKVIDDANPYSQSVGEASPIGRLLYVGTEGSGFQPSSGQHYKTVNSRTNNTTAYSNDSYNTGIRLWNYDGTSSGVYATGSLAVTEVTDEAGNVTVLYKDVNGRGILKRQIITPQVIDGTTESCLDTYYVYDNAGELVAIVPPKAVAAIRNVGGTWNINSASGLVFQYVYDVQGRLTQKRVPSSDWIYIVYDPMNRPVLSQDGNLRGPTNNLHKWAYYKYDVKGRLVSQGVYVDAVNGISLSAMQSYVNGLNYSTYWYEERQSGTAPVFYTNRIFPTTNQDNSALQDLLYFYYDDYDLNGDGTADYSYQPQGLSGEESATAFTRAAPTVLYKRTLNNDGTLNVWLETVKFYDKHGNSIQTLSNNQINTSGVGDQTTIVPDFIGKPSQVKVSKTVVSTTTTTLTSATYDSYNRLVTLDQSNNGGSPVHVAQYVYNELGQLVNKMLHSTDGVNFFQDVDFRYNIHGLLTSINNSTLSVDNTNYTNFDNNDIFGEEILYEKTDANIGNTAYYNGNISAVKWEAQSPATNSQRSYVYSYDQLNRLVSAHYQDRAYQSTGAWGNAGANDETGITYDLNGNIKTLQRYLLGTKIDDLTYTLSGNQLTNVSDLGTTAGFNGTNATAYSFDNTGNLITDPKKGVTITYNVLNKTDKIYFTATGNYIRYTYDGGGQMIRKESYTASSQITVTTDYIGGFVYQNQSLSYFAMAEGRVRNNGGTLTFEYFMRDHLGNVRVSFDGTGSGAVVRQETSYYPFGMILPGNYVPSAPSNNLFNGGSEWQNDFGNMPDLYQTYFRNYDAELGRFISVDPKADMDESMTPYHFADDNPVSENDPDGDAVPYLGPSPARNINYIIATPAAYTLMITGDAPNYLDISAGANPDDDGGYSAVDAAYANELFDESASGGLQPIPNQYGGMGGPHAGGGSTNGLEVGQRGAPIGGAISIAWPLFKSRLLEMTQWLYPELSGGSLENRAGYVLEYAYMRWHANYKLGENVITRGETFPTVGVPKRDNVKPDGVADLTVENDEGAFTQYPGARWYEVKSSPGNLTPSGPDGDYQIEGLYNGLRNYANHMGWPTTFKPHVVFVTTWDVGLSVSKLEKNYNISTFQIPAWFYIKDNQWYITFGFDTWLLNSLMFFDGPGVPAERVPLGWH